MIIDKNKTGSGVFLYTLKCVPLDMDNYLEKLEQHKKDYEKWSIDKYGRRPTLENTVVNKIVEIPIHTKFTYSISSNLSITVTESSDESLVGKSYTLKSEDFGYIKTDNGFLVDTSTFLTVKNDIELDEKSYTYFKSDDNDAIIEDYKEQVIELYRIHVAKKLEENIKEIEKTVNDFTERGSDLDFDINHIEFDFKLPKLDKFNIVLKKGEEVYYDFTSDTFTSIDHAKDIEFNADSIEFEDFE